MLEQYGDDLDELRSPDGKTIIRNKKEKQIIDSSQVAGAQVIRKAMKKWKANKLKKAKEAENEKNIMSKAPNVGMIKINNRQDPKSSNRVVPHGGPLNQIKESENEDNLDGNSNQGQG